jgi:hypothetical protein
MNLCLLASSSKSRAQDLRPLSVSFVREWDYGWMVKRVGRLGLGVELLPQAIKKLRNKTVKHVRYLLEQRSESHKDHSAQTV